MVTATKGRLGCHLQDLGLGNWLEEIQSPEGLARMVQEGFKDTTVMVLVRRIKNELERNKYIKKRSSLDNILTNLQNGKVVLVDIPRMSDRSELFLLSVISRYILEDYKRERGPGVPQKLPHNHRGGAASSWGRQQHLSL